MSVTAAAGEVPVSRTGAPVTVIDSVLLENLGKVDVLEAIRTVPGLQIVQTGARGRTASLFIRGGEASFNKVLLDGVPANDIGGAFDFGNLTSTGVDSVEVLRGSNSVLYGSDALTGVVSLTTPRGHTPQPEVSYSIDGGTLGTFRQAASLGGAVKRFDYFLNFAHFQTDNDVPNNEFQNGTFAGRLGYALGNSTDLSVTVRRTRTAMGSPNGISFFGIADDSSSFNRFTMVSATANSQWTPRWRSIIRAGATTENSHFVNPSPTGERSDPSEFANFLGNVVTIRGANGHSATGRAILDFGGTYPSTFDSRTSRWSLYGQTDYQIVDGLNLAGGVRLESEFGVNVFGAPSKTNRNNAGYFIEVQSSSSYRAQGLELSAESQVTRMFRISGSYTFLDTLVRKSFSGSALAPAINPNIPGAPIGAFSLLVGARPFRRPAHTGNLVVSYRQGPAHISLAGYFAGKADDSTFLSDANFGSTLLLPNKDLSPGYQKVDLSGSYRFGSHFKWYARSKIF